MSQKPTGLTGIKQKDETPNRQKDKAIPRAKQMTVWIDSDLYRAMMIAKAKGGGSLKEQINGAIRQKLGVRDVAELEAQERAAWEKKPWGKEDQEELELWQSAQHWEDE